MMVDDDWMDEVLDDGTSGPDRDESGRPTASIRSVVDQIRDSVELTKDEIAAKVNEALAEEALNVRYSRTIHDTQAEALREHQYSPNVVDPDPNARRPEPTAEELVAQADAIEAAGRREYDLGRSELVDEYRRLHEQGFPVSSQAWLELSSLDEDGSISSAFEEIGSLEELAERAQPEQEREQVQEISPSGIDFSREVTPGARDRQAERESSLDGGRRDRQEYVEVEAPVSHAEAEAEVAEEKGPQGPDPEVAATVARHKREASKRKSGQPQQVGGLMADFFRQHGRNLDGTKIEPVGPKDEGLEL